MLVEPRDFVIVEGLLPLHTKLARACFDITVYLDPPEEIRRKWKIRRDCAERGYTPEAVLAELDRREPDSAAFIRPQRQCADIAIRFAPVAGHEAGRAMTPRCPRRYCFARPSATPTCPTCSPTTTGARST